MIVGDFETFHAEFRSFSILFIRSSITGVGTAYAKVNFSMSMYIEHNQIFVFLGLWLLIFLLPAFQSLFTQWMEVRADHLGATLLDGGNAQMANSLTILCEYQDRALEKSVGYHIDFKNEQEANKKDKKISSLERDSWFFRFLEFQFMSHPPMYWRVHALQTTETEWSIRKIKLWWCSRFRESLPN